VKNWVGEEGSGLGEGGGGLVGKELGVRRVVDGGGGERGWEWEPPGDSFGDRSPSEKQVGRYK